MKCVDNCELEDLNNNYYPVTYLHTVAHYWISVGGTFDVSCGIGQDNLVSFNAIDSFSGNSDKFHLLFFPVLNEVHRGIKKIWDIFNVNIVYISVNFRGCRTKSSFGEISWQGYYIIKAVSGLL